MLFSFNFRVIASRSNAVASVNSNESPQLAEISRGVGINSTIHPEDFAKRSAAIA